jgi:DNA-binding transcriptional ArsR family regulator
MINKEELNDDALAMIATRFRILADPMRLKILHTLGEREMNVTDLVEATGAGQANVSKHLGVMLEAEIVARRKDGLNSYYKIADETIFELCDVVCGRLKKQVENKRKALTGGL